MCGIEDGCPGPASMYHQRPATPPPAPPKDPINRKKEEFMLQFILNARLSGRSADLDGDNDRWRLVKAAEDLWDRTQAACKVK